MECNYWSFTLQGGSAPGRVWLAGAEGAGGPGKAGQNHQAGGEEEEADTPGGGFGGGAVRPQSTAGLPAALPDWVCSVGGGVSRLSPAALHPPPQILSLDLSETKARVGKGNRHDGVRLNCALLITDSRARLSGRTGIVGGTQHVQLWPDRSGDRTVSSQLRSWGGFVPRYTPARNRKQDKE
jgi:hypothetical protein